MYVIRIEPKTRQDDDRMCDALKQVAKAFPTLEIGEEDEYLGLRQIKDDDCATLTCAIKYLSKMVGINQGGILQEI